MKCDLLFPTTVFVDQYDIDNGPLVALAHARRGAGAGVTKTNAGGFQSDADFLKDESCRELSARIDASLEVIREGLSISPRLFRTGGWVNINGRGDFNFRHVHPRSYFSGVYYLQGGPQTGRIIFHTPLIAKEMLDPECDQEMLGVTTHNVVYDPVPGRIVFFPAWLEHSVEPNHSEEERISISFNVSY